MHMYVHVLVSVMICECCLLICVCSSSLWFFCVSPSFSVCLDEYELVQKKAFTKWINSHLEKVRHLTFGFVSYFDCVSAKIFIL